MGKENETGHVETKYLRLEIKQLVRSIRFYMNMVEYSHCKLFHFVCSHDEFHFLRFQVSNS